MLIICDIKRYCKISGETKSLDVYVWISDFSQKWLPNQSSVKFFLQFLASQKT